MKPKQAKKRVAIDVGGTFTDCLVLDEKGELTKFKASTTPQDPSDGFMHAHRVLATLGKYMRDCCC